MDVDRITWNYHVAAWDKAREPIKSLKRKQIVGFLKTLTETEAVNAYRKGGKVVHRGAGRTLSRQSVKHILRIIRNVLDDAADNGHIDVNPARGVRVPKMDPREEVWTFLTAEEIAKVMMGPYGPKMDPRTTRAILAVAIYAGLRKSEIWRLRWEHLNLDDRAPTLLVKGSKTASGNRPVPLFPPVLDALKAHQNRGKVKRVKGLVFPSPSGGQHSRTFDAGWSDRAYRPKGASLDDPPKVRPGIKTRVGITRAVRFHDLRHTYCSHLVQGTWGHAFSLQEVRDLAGHSAVGVT